jgi:hypothetical protein
MNILTGECSTAHSSPSFSLLGSVCAADQRKLNAERYIENPKEQCNNNGNPLGLYVCSQQEDVCSFRSNAPPEDRVKYCLPVNNLEKEVEDSGYAGYAEGNTEGDSFAFEWCKAEKCGLGRRGDITIDKLKNCQNLPTIDLMSGKDVYAQPESQTFDECLKFLVIHGAEGGAPVDIAEISVYSPSSPTRTGTYVGMGYFGATDHFYATTSYTNEVGELLGATATAGSTDNKHTGHKGYFYQDENGTVRFVGGGYYNEFGTFIPSGNFYDIASCLSKCAFK